MTGSQLYWLRVNRMRLGRVAFWHAIGFEGNPATSRREVRRLEGLLEVPASVVERLRERGFYPPKGAK